MAQVTIYIPNDLESKVKDMASSLDVSISKFISSVLQQKVQNVWTNETRKLAGSWDDFPSLSDIRITQGEDCQREAF